ncbi:hypothetical protein TrVE_jg6116 [Triparma verrucosa]|uniref:Sulfatase N-terminal domain-containing protein n=1 Tax=Triparma verrucosa TaxID=1606542 RepID=A0A9W7BGW8_9STRA|nr:hypothetical protein TrVE_jg6116 [Triparma verrucosa]
MPKPDVLVIVSDDQGYADTAWTGPFPTANLERLKNESTTLSNFYVHPVCTPTRAALLTGKYAGHSGMTGPLLLAAPCHLDDDGPSFGKEMKKRGYYNVLSGKWHLGHHAWKHTPVGHGFDEFHGVLNCCAAYYSKSYYHPLYGHKIDWRNNTDAVAPAPPKHASEEFADRLIEVIRSTPKSQPLFMMFTFTAPHSPLQSEARHTELCAHVNTERRRIFCGLMMSVDEAVGRVRGAMEEAGRWENSLVTYFNDNGGNVWEGGRNYPYRGGKQSSFEGGARATSFIKFPKSDQKLLPSDFKGLAHVSDVMPTILGYLDRQEGKEEPWQTGDDDAGLGFDISLPLLQPEKPTPLRSSVLMSFEPATGRLGFRFENWKLVAGAIGDPRRFEEPTSDSSWLGTGFHDRVGEIIMHFQHGLDEDASGTMDETVREVSVLVGAHWGKILNFVGLSSNALPDVLLYDLSVDPYEDNNVASENPEVVKDMFARVDNIKANFGENCDWFVMDKKITFEEVSYIDESSGERITKLYHTPFVADEDFDTYEPELFDVGPFRKYGAAGIVALEAFVMIWMVFKLIKGLVRPFAATKSKKD